MFCIKKKHAREAIPAKLKAPITKTSVNRVKLTLQAERLKYKQFETEIIEMKKELSNKSLQVTDELSHDLLSIIADNGDKMSPFMKRFWQQQTRNSLPKATGGRYHPMLIRWCISIASKSSSAYDELRETFQDGFVQLPSRRVLRDYTNAITPKVSFNPRVINELKCTTGATVKCNGMFSSCLMK